VIAIVVLLVLLFVIYKLSIGRAGLHPGTTHTTYTITIGGNTFHGVTFVRSYPDVISIYWVNGRVLTLPGQAFHMELETEGPTLELPTERTPQNLPAEAVR
jgi:hypothetical protein